MLQSGVYVQRGPGSPGAGLPGGRGRELHRRRGRGRLRQRLLNPAHSSPGFSYAFLMDFTSAVVNISLHFDTFHKFFLLDMRILLITIHQQLLVHKYDLILISNIFKTTGM